jgi:hypothetical protein
VVLARIAVDVDDAARFAVLAHQDLVRDGVGLQCQLLRLHGRRERGRRSREIRSGHAAASAVAAPVAGGAPFVPFGQNSGAANGHDTIAVSIDNLLELHLAAAEIHRRKELAVGQRFVAFGTSADADKRFHNVVIRCKLLVTDGPVLPEAIVRCGLQIVITQPVGLASPGERPSPDVAGANPVEGLVLRSGVGKVGVVDVELRGELAGEAGCAALADFDIAGLAEAAKRHLVRPGMFLEFLRRVYHAPGIEHQNFHAAFAELLGRPAAGSAGSDYNGVVSFHAWCSGCVQPL